MTVRSTFAMLSLTPNARIAPMTIRAMPPPMPMVGLLPGPGGGARGSGTESGGGCAAPRVERGARTGDVTATGPAGRRPVPRCPGDAPHGPDAGRPAEPARP